ncbi:tyrosine-type recombinase/integrase [Alcaligenes faecalis]|uniref:tyrosine-type recombinase/integrase n=1 Tax=Alcaligenes faecalis TaxID=511 RepID=UPI00208FC2FA|nr:site-specific integrase [Alcaligenes faecalis]USP49381.1 site-specific integrase [Alcaligenes faecalis]
MASITKHTSGYRAQIKLTLQQNQPPYRESRIFPTKREAQVWAIQRETELRDQALADPKLQFTLRMALRRYAAEVSPTKRGERWEKIRLSAFECYHLPLDQPLVKVSAQDIADFRDSRALSLAPASIRRELCLISSVFETARLEWGWADHNPCKDIRKPQNSKHRERVLQWWEIKRMLREMGYHRSARPASFGQAVAMCMLLALRTGMRAGELTSLPWDQVHDRHCHLPITKSGRPRDVPLSTKALKILERMHGWDDKLVFGIKAASLDALFRKYRQRAGLEGFTWHDTRHTAATMLSKKVAVLDLCKIFGWTDPKMAMVYYNPHASTLADLLG